MLLVQAGPDLALTALLASDLSTDEALEEALRQLRVHPAMAQAREQLQAYVDQAREIAETLPAGRAREALLSLTEYVLARTG